MCFGILGIVNFNHKHGIRTNMKKLILSIALTLHVGSSLQASCPGYQKESPAFVESTNNSITFCIPHSSSKDLPYYTFGITSPEGNITDLIIKSSEFNISFTFDANVIHIVYTSLNNSADNFSETFQFQKPINQDTITTSYDGDILRINFVYE